MSKTFVYTEDLENYQWVLETPILECRSKHVLSLESEKAKMLLEASSEIGYPGCMWGYTSAYLKDPEVNRVCQMFTIHKMLQKGISNSLRVIIGKKNDIWLDNMHTAIRNVLIYGYNVKLKDINMYIVDMRNPQIPVVVNYNNSLNSSLDDIKAVVDRGENRMNRTKGRVRDINYTACEFINDNNITIESFMNSLDTYRSKYKS